jgi:hypothetical protein
MSLRTAPIAAQLNFKEQIRTHQELYIKYRYGEGRQLFANPTTSAFDQERIPKLSGEVANIKTGTSWKLARRKAVMTILNTTRAAVERCR